MGLWTVLVLGMNCNQDSTYAETVNIKEALLIINASVFSSY